VPPWKERADCSNLAERITIGKLNFTQLNKPKILNESDLASVVLVGMMTQGDPPFCNEKMLGNLVKEDARAGGIRARRGDNSRSAPTESE
jgi:hypothetical protein